MNPETPCKNCAFKLGEHRGSDEACPKPFAQQFGGEMKWHDDSTFSPKEDPEASKPIAWNMLCANCGRVRAQHSKTRCPTWTPVPGRMVMETFSETMRFKAAEDPEGLPAGSDLGPSGLCANCGCTFDKHNAKGNCPIRFQDGHAITFSAATFKADPGFKDINPGGPAIYFREPRLAASRANLRKVVFGRWATEEEMLADQLKRDPGQPPAAFKIFGIPGVFHCFGSAYEEFESGPGNYSTAIVEAEDGRVFEIIPSDMKFLS